MRRRADVWSHDQARDGRVAGMAFLGSRGAFAGGVAAVEGEPGVGRAGRRDCGGVAGGGALRIAWVFDAPQKSAILALKFVLREIPRFAGKAAPLRMTPSRFVFYSPLTTLL